MRRGRTAKNARHPAVENLETRDVPTAGLMGQATVSVADTPLTPIAPTATLLYRTDIIGSGTQIYIQFSDTMAGPSVRNPANFAVFPSDANGNILPGARAIPVVAAVYDDGSMIETIRTRTTLRPLGTYLLAINAGPTGVKSDQGVILAGTGGLNTAVLTHDSPPDIVYAPHNLHAKHHHK